MEKSDNSTEDPDDCRGRSGVDGIGAGVRAAVRTPHTNWGVTHDNSGWNGYNNGGYNNTWFDGKTYRSDPMPLGEDIASDAASGTR